MTEEITEPTVEEAPKTPTSALDWPNKPQVYELPSGAVVLARKPYTFVWIKTGQVPDNIRATMESDDVTMEERVALVDWYLHMCILEPKVTLKKTKNAGDLFVDEIDDFDRSSLINSLGINI